MAGVQNSIKIRYFGPIRFTIGQKEEEIKINSSAINLVELINMLTKRYGHELKNLLMEENGELKENLTVYINNQKVNEIKEKVCQGDEVYFFIALTGG
ncbi:MAG: MoaD/ThiS family protein [Bacillota bacterium]